MVNFGLNSASILGLILIIAGVALIFFLMTNPHIRQGSDTLLSGIAILSGGILFFHGWRLDPILLFGQILLVLVATFYTVESIRLRR